MGIILPDQLETVECLDCKKKYTKAMCIIIVQAYTLRLCIKCYNRRKKDGKITKDELIYRRI